MNWIKISLMFAALAMGAFTAATVQLDLSKMYGHWEPVRISADFGGRLDQYIEKYADIRHSGKKVQVEDVCLSACTMVLGLVPAERICVNSNTIFGFHSAAIMTMLGPQFSWEGTRLLWHIYPTKVRELLVKKGWDGDANVSHLDLLYVPGTDLYPLCN